MATGADPTTNTYNIDQPTDIGGLLGAVLGKQTNTNSNQDSKATTNTTTDGTSNLRGDVKNLTNTFSNTDATNNSNSQQTNKNQTATKTTGDVLTNSNSNTSSNSTTTTNADTSALRDVYAKQAAGITPDMLAAIFREGAKAAPNLAIAQSNALGARGVGNTPEAVALNQMNSNLVDQAANMNRQMLSDSSATAGRIADLTKSTNTSGNSSTSSLSDAINNLTSTTDTNGIVNSIVNAINSSKNVGGSNSDTLTNNDTTTHNNTTGTQDTTTTNNTNASTTINTGVAKSLLGLAAGGLGLAALYKMATGKGFGGTISDFAKWLKDSGAPPSAYAGATPVGTVEPGAAPSPGDVGQLPTPEPSPIVAPIDQPIDQPISDNTDATYNDFFNADGGLVGYADGGSLFLKAPDLTPKTNDSDLALAMHGSDPTGALSQALGLSDNATGMGNYDASGNGSGAVGPNGASNGTLGGAIGMGSSMLGLLGAISTGNPLGITANLLGMVSKSNAMDDSPSVTNQIAPTTFDIDMTAPESEAAPDTDTNGGETGTGTGDGSDGGAYADGGPLHVNNPGAEEVAEGENPLEIDDDEMMEALGIQKGKVPGTLVANTSTIKTMLGALKRGPIQGDTGRGSSAPGYSNGGQVEGPGTGTSDSVPAKVDNKPIRLSAGEYVIPADVVKKFGVSAFDKLIAQHHIPAEMQQAITGVQ
jgi:hypothetical protein